MQKPIPSDHKINFEHFTDAARLVLAIANQFARERGFAAVGPEHMLLAMLRRPEGGAAIILAEIQDFERLRQKFDGLVGTGSDGNNGGKLGLSTTSRSVLLHAISESKKIGHAKVGTEHLLLGLLATPTGIAQTELTGVGLTLEGVRNSVSELIPPSPLTGGEYLTRVELTQRRQVLKDHQQRLHEERLTKALHRLLTDWQEAGQIRAFVSELKAKATNEESPSSRIAHLMRG